MEGPPFLVKIDSILSQACRLTVSIRDKRTDDVVSDDEDDERPQKRARIAASKVVQKVWLTIGLTRVCTGYKLLHFSTDTEGILQDAHVI